MTICDLRENVRADNRDFVRSSFTIADERARTVVDWAFGEEARLRKALEEQLEAIKNCRRRCCEKRLMERYRNVTKV